MILWIQSGCDSQQTQIWLSVQTSNGPPRVFLAVFDPISSQLARRMSNILISSGLRCISLLKMVKKMCLTKGFENLSLGMECIQLAATVNLAWLEVAVMMSQKGPKIPYYEQILS